MLEKWYKGRIVQVEDMITARISSELIKYKEFYAIYADIIETKTDMICCTIKIDENVALILRDKEKMLEMGLNSEERKAIYCHELGHVFSKNQKDNDKQNRNLEDEIDSDTFAIEKCEISPIIVESALKKTYEYEIANIKNKPDINKERIDRFIEEMSARKRNIEKLKLKTENDKKER